LWAGGINFTPKQVQYLIQKNSIILDQNQWKNKVIFGVINQQASILCLQDLQKLQSEMSEKKFKSKFKKIVDEIVQKNLS
jgi:hypothetical protein